MIRTEREYQYIVQRLEQECEYIKLQREKLQELGLTEEDVSRAMEPTLSFHEQLKDEVEYYEKIKRGDFNALINLQGLGKLLIGIRISLGISQSELSKRLNVSEAQVSKDERNEYHGISVEKAQRTLDALGVTVMTKVEHVPFKTAV